MDCRGYRSNMWPYLKNELDDDKIFELIEHVYECHDCKEELKIQFMVSEGLKRLESGNYGFNLHNDYENMLNNSLQRCKHIRLANMLITSGATLTFVFSVFIIILSLLF